MHSLLTLVLTVIALIFTPVAHSASPNAVDLYLPVDTAADQMWIEEVGDESLIEVREAYYKDIHELSLTGNSGVQWFHLRGTAAGTTSVRFDLYGMDDPTKPLNTMVYRLTVDGQLNVMIWGVEVLEPENKPRGQITEFFYTYGGYTVPRTYELRRDDSGGYRKCINQGNETAASPDLCTGLEELIERYDIVSWNGFKKSNRFVLDGEMFSLRIVYDNGFVIDAHGDNSFPEHYYEFQAAVDELFGVEE